MYIFEWLFWGLKKTRKVIHEAVYFKPRSESWVADLGGGDRKIKRENVGVFLGNVLHLRRWMGLLPNMLRAEGCPCHPTQQRPCHQPQGSPGSRQHSTGYKCFKEILRPLILHGMFMRVPYWYSEPGVDSSWFLQRRVERSGLTLTFCKASLPHLLMGFPPQTPFLSTFLPDTRMAILRCSLVPSWPCISCISFPQKQMPNDARNAALNRIELITFADDDDAWLLMWDL